MEKNETWSTSGICSWTLAISDIYIYDLTKTVNAISTEVLFADDMSVIITGTNNEDFFDNIKPTLEKLKN
jgi:hypothetical protein